VYIEVCWTPGESTIKKKTNIYDFDNVNIPVQSRLCTFDNDGSLVKTTILEDKKIREKIELYCSDIAVHIFDVTNGRTIISYIELIFKTDPDNTIWLQYCPKIKVKGGDQSLNSTETFSILKGNLNTSLRSCSLSKNKKRIVVKEGVRLTRRRKIPSIEELQPDTCIYCNSTFRLI